MKTFREQHLFLHRMGDGATLVTQVPLKLTNAADSSDQRPRSVTGTAYASVNRFLVLLCNGERIFTLRQPLNSLPAAPSCGHDMS